MEERYHKYRKGQMELERVLMAMDGLEMNEDVRNAVIDYFVHGKMMGDMNVKPHILTPFLMKVNSNITVENSFLKRFLYTDDFSPRKRLDAPHTTDILK